MRGRGRQPLDAIDPRHVAGGPTGDEGGISVDGFADDERGAARRTTHRETPKRQSLPLRLALGGAVVFVVGLLVTAGAKGYRDLEIVRQREAELGGRISAAEQRLDELRHRLELLREDPATLERLAREELGLVGPEDIVFVLPEDGVTRPVSGTP
ncbi:MAG TPA: septum formation initiator family protein [Thermoanaerobaculia bacterium]|nr:septum formation initiator family protein [Thermoanaerobaculia bacterium]